MQRVFKKRAEVGITIQNKVDWKAKNIPKVKEECNFIMIRETIFLLDITIINTSLLNKINPNIRRGS